MTADRLEAALATSSRDLLGYFERRVDPRADAADLLADTMLVAWRRVRDLPADDEGVRRWLFGIARHVLRDAERGRRRRHRLAARLRATIGASASPPADAGSEVRDAIARLEPELAELVRLVHWEGFSVADAAEIVGIPASTARGRHQRAKEQLRAALAVDVPRSGDTVGSEHF